MTYYRALGLNADGLKQESGREVPYTTADITKAYKKQALLLHPDRHKGIENQKKTTVSFTDIAQIYKVLSNPKERAIYNKKTLPDELKRSVNSNNTPVKEDLPVVEESVFAVIKRVIDDEETTVESEINLTSLIRNGRYSQSTLLTFAERDINVSTWMLAYHFSFKQMTISGRFALLFMIEEQVLSTSSEMDSTTLSQKNSLIQALHSDCVDISFYEAHLQGFHEACLANKIRANLFLEKHLEILENLTLDALKKLPEDLPMVIKFMEQSFVEKTEEEILLITNDDEASRQFRIALTAYCQEHLKIFNQTLKDHLIPLQTEYDSVREQIQTRQEEVQTMLASVPELRKTLTGKAQLLGLVALAQTKLAERTSLMKKMERLCNEIKEKSLEFLDQWQDFPHFVISDEMIQTLDIEILVIGCECLRVSADLLLMFFEDFMEQREQSVSELNHIFNKLSQEKGVFVISTLMSCIDNKKGNSPEQYLSQKHCQMLFSHYFNWASDENLIAILNYFSTITDEPLIKFYTDLFLSRQTSLPFVELLELIEFQKPMIPIRRDAGANSFFKENTPLLRHFLKAIEDDDIASILNAKNSALKLVLWLIHCQISSKEIVQMLPKKEAECSLSELSKLFFNYFSALQQLYLYIEKDKDHPSLKDPITQEIFDPLFNEICARYYPDIVYIKTNDVSVQLNILSRNYTYYRNKIEIESRILTAWMRNICCNGSEEQIGQFLVQKEYAEIVLNYMNNPTLSKELPFQTILFASLESNTHWNQFYMTGALLKAWRHFTSNIVRKGPEIMDSLTRQQDEIAEGLNELGLPNNKYLIKAGLAIAKSIGIELDTPEPLEPATIAFVTQLIEEKNSACLTECEVKMPPFAMEGYSRLTRSRIYQKKVEAYDELFNQLSVIAQYSEETYTHVILNGLFELLCQAGLDKCTFVRIKEILQEKHYALFVVLTVLIVKSKEKFGVMNLSDAEMISTHAIDFSYTQIPDFAMKSPFVAECYIAQDPAHIPIDFLVILLKTHGEKIASVVARYSLEPRLVCYAEVNRLFEKTEKETISYVRKIEDTLETIRLFFTELLQLIHKLSLNDVWINIDNDEIRVFYASLLDFSQKNPNLLGFTHELSLILKPENSPSNVDNNEPILTRWLFELLLDEMNSSHSNNVYANIVKLYIEKNDPEAKTFFQYLAKTKKMIFLSSDIAIIREKVGEEIAEKIKTLKRADFNQSWNDVSNISDIDVFIKENIAYIHENADTMDSIVAYVNQALKDKKALNLSKLSLNELSKHLNIMHQQAPTQVEENYQELTQWLVKNHEKIDSERNYLNIQSPNTIAAQIVMLEKRRDAIGSFFRKNKKSLAIDNLINRLKLYAYTHNIMHTELNLVEKEKVNGNNAIINQWLASKIVRNNKKRPLLPFIKEIYKKLGYEKLIDNNEALIKKHRHFLPFKITTATEDAIQNLCKFFNTTATPAISSFNPDSPKVSQDDFHRGDANNVLNNFARTAVNTIDLEQSKHDAQWGLVPVGPVRDVSKTLYYTLLKHTSLMHFTCPQQQHEDHTQALLIVSRSTSSGR